MYSCLKLDAEKEILLDWLILYWFNWTFL